MQIFARDDRLDIEVQVDASSKPIVVSYNHVKMLKGRENVPDWIRISSCSLETLDTNGGHESDSDVIVIPRQYRPCNEALKIVIRNHPQ